MGEQDLGEQDMDEQDVGEQDECEEFARRHIPAIGHQDWQRGEVDVKISARWGLRPLITNGR
jgi:hypothetical protein